MIFFYSRKIATVTGSVVKTVECEHCQAQFSFPFKCEAVGTAIAPYYLFGGWAEQRAENRATKKLERRLAQETEAVPCPACGRFQRDMVRQFAKRIANLSLVWVVLAWVIIGIACVSIEIKHSKHEIDWTYPSYTFPLGIALTVLAVAASTLFYYLYDPSKMSIPFVNMEPKRNIPVKRITGGGGSGSSRSGSSREVAGETNESHNSNEAIELAPSRSSPSTDIFDTPPDKVTVACPHCAKSYRIAPELLGRSAVCKKCSKKFKMESTGGDGGGGFDLNSLREIER